MRYLSIAALLLALAAPAWGQDYNIVATPPPYNTLFHLPAIVFDLGNMALAPRDTGVDLGQQQAPWRHVFAQEYIANGYMGLTINVPLGNGCLLHFQGGLLVAVTGGFFGSCGQ